MLDAWNSTAMLERRLRLHPLCFVEGKAMLDAREIRREDKKISVGNESIKKKSMSTGLALEWWCVHCRHLQNWFADVLSVVSTTTFVVRLFQQRHAESDRRCWEVDLRNRRVACSIWGVWKRQRTVVASTTHFDDFVWCVYLSKDVICLYWWLDGLYECWKSKKLSCIHHDPWRNADMRWNVMSRNWK